MQFRRAGILCSDLSSDTLLKPAAAIADV